MEWILIVNMRQQLISSTVLGDKFLNRSNIVGRRTLLCHSLILISNCEWDQVLSKFVRFKNRSPLLLNYTGVTKIVMFLELFSLLEIRKYKITLSNIKCKTSLKAKVIFESWILSILHFHLYGFLSTYFCNNPFIQQNCPNTPLS